MSNNEPRIIFTDTWHPAPEDIAPGDMVVVYGDSFNWTHCTRAITAVNKGVSVVAVSFAYYEQAEKLMFDLRYMRVVYSTDPDFIVGEPWPESKIPTDFLRNLTPPPRGIGPIRDWYHRS